MCKFTIYVIKIYLSIFIKKNNFLSNSFSFFIIYKMYTFDQYFWLEITNTYTTKFAHFV